MTIVFAPHSPGVSHVGRTLLVADVLRARGHRCVFVGDSPLILAEGGMVERAGFEAVHLTDLSMAEVVAGRNFDYHTPTSLRRLVEAEREMIRALRPSVIVSSYRPSIHVAAAIEGVPLVAITNTHYTRYWATPLTPPLEHPITVRVSSLVGERLAMTLLKPITPLVADRLFRKTVGIYNDLLAEHGLPGHRDILALQEGSHLTYLADAPEWCETRMPLPPKVRVAGPLYWTAEAPDDWERALLPDEPFVYLSAGSSGNPAIFPALFRELGALPCRVVMTTAGLPLPDGVPDNFTVTEFLPGDAVMRRSAFAILNGGSGTMYQAIATRTPMLLTPMRADQEWNTKDALRLGIARSVHCRDVIAEPGRLRRAAEAMWRSCSDLREALEAIAPKLTHYRAAETVADGVAALAEAAATEVGLRA